MLTTISTHEQQALDFLESTGTTLSFKYDGFKKYFDEDQQPRNIFNWTLSRGKRRVRGKFGSSIMDSCKLTPKIDSYEPVEIYFGFSIKKNVTRSELNKIYFGYKINTTCNILKQIMEEKIRPESIIDDKELAKEYTQFSKEYSTTFKKPLTGFSSSLDSVKNEVVRHIYYKIEKLKSETSLFEQSDTIVQPTAYDLLSCLTKYDPGSFEDFCDNYGYDTDSRRAEKTYKDVCKEWKGIRNLFTDYELEQLAEIQ